MQQLSKMLTRLTLETQVYHASIDALLQAPLARPSRSGYRRFLCLAYGFEAPVEGRLAHAPGVEIGFIHDRLKAGRIASDLLSLGLTTPEYGMLARRHDVPAFKSGAEAMGWLYVTERVTLQHEAIRRLLADKLPHEYKLAHEYLTTYERTAGVRWRELGMILDDVAWSEHTASLIVEAACDAFDAQREWLMSHEQTDRVLVAPLRAS